MVEVNTVDVGRKIGYLSRNIAGKTIRIKGSMEEAVNKKADESKKKKRTSLKSILGGDILATDFFRIYGSSGKSGIRSRIREIAQNVHLAY